MADFSTYPDGPLTSFDHWAPSSFDPTHPLDVEVGIAQNDPSYTFDVVSWNHNPSIATLDPSANWILSGTFHTLSPTCSIDIFLQDDPLTVQVGCRLSYGGGIILTCTIFSEDDSNSSTVNPYDNSLPHLLELDYGHSGPGVLTVSIDGNPVVQLAPATVGTPKKVITATVDPHGQSGFAVAWLNKLTLAQA